MSFTRGQVDRFGRPIPPSPGIQILINDDGSEVQQRNRLILPASLVATDSEDNDASVLTLGAVAPGDLAPIAAQTVIGNNTGSTAVPSATTATAIGFGVLAAATQAALTALIAVATTSLAGLMSALDKLKVDSQPVTIQDLDFSAVSSITSTTWTAGAYKRIEIFLKVATGAAGAHTFKMVGLADGGGYLNLANNINAGLWTQVQTNAKSDWELTASAIPFELHAFVNVKVDGTRRLLTGQYADYDENIKVMTGIHTDVTNQVTGVVLTLAAVSAGNLKIIGHK